MSHHSHNSGNAMDEYERVGDGDNKVTTNMNSSDNDEACMDEPGSSRQGDEVIHQDDEVASSMQHDSLSQNLGDVAAAAVAVASVAADDDDDDSGGGISSLVSPRDGGGGCTTSPTANDDDNDDDDDTDTTGPFTGTGTSSLFHSRRREGGLRRTAGADSSRELSLGISSPINPIVRTSLTSNDSSYAHTVLPDSTATLPPPPPPPAPLHVSIMAASPKVSSLRPSTLRTVHSGRSLHSEESKSNLLAAAVAAAAAATATRNTPSSNAGSSSSGSNAVITSSASFKKPAYRNFLQRTQAVRPRYNPNRNNKNSNSNSSDNNSDHSGAGASSSIDVVPHHHHVRGGGGGDGGGSAVGGTAMHHHSAPYAAAAGGRATSPSMTTFSGAYSSSSSPARQPHHHTSNSKAALLASRLARRGKYKSGHDEKYTNSAAVSGGGNTTDSINPPLMGSGGAGGAPTAAAASMSATTTTTGLHRKYKMGDQVLVCNHQSRWANLVNRHGFPPREGATPEERRGPYLYVLAQVKSVHFEEYSVYYTVVRADTGAEQRADADFMEPLTSPRGQLAALRAATQPMENDNPMNPEDYVPQPGDSQSKCMAILEEICFVLLCPFLWTWDLLRFVCVNYLCPLRRVTMQFLTGQSRLFLNGMEPYTCRLRITAVNLCVICSTWYMFIDQARLAFFPSSADHALAVINLIVWLILILELTCEVFIRADNYGELIVSEKAYSPTTVRYINSFHLIVESISLALFIPEFYCLFPSSKYACDDRMPFSFYNAALMAVTGPTQLKAFYGRAFFALIRLRVFGLLRHWKTMWIVNTFIHMKWKANKSGLLANIIPSRASITSRKSSVMNGSNQNNGSTGGANNGNGNDPNDDEAALTSASTIGTALMVTNSYRALAILWVITGLFPLISCLVTSSTNSVAPQLTEQLQATNLVSNDTSNATCAFLTDSVISWASALRAPDFYEEPSDPYLIGLQLEPHRCFEDEDILDHMCRPVLNAAQRGTLHTMAANDEENADRVHIALELCQTYKRTKGSSITELAHELGLRPGSILQFYQLDEALLFNPANGTATILTNFSVLATFDETYTIQAAAVYSFILQFILLVSVLGGLSVLRRDAEVLVLGPLRRMLKIVARYAKNPLRPTKFKRRRPMPSSINRRRHSQRTVSGGDNYSDASNSGSDSDDSDNDDVVRGGSSNDALGRYETEQLITAVTKITDLLRKCWGVAGADIISTNLDSQEGLKQVFNPTVPGKKVYALFAFAAITDFAHAQRTLGGNVMILINHVAGVVHDEVFRWGFGDSGACNKNLGSSFLLVFRIGLVSEVQNKLKQAKDVLFNHGPKASQATKRPKKALTGSTDHSTTALSHSAASSTLSTNLRSSIRINNNIGGKVGGSPTHGRRKSLTGASKRAGGNVSSASTSETGTMSLASLPGINAFTDRAVIGMLKSFAGIHRDKKIRDWNNSFELSAGVGTFTVSMIYGMDAGWAMEGAVGSEYKIDATYLSPHVNMASRMMSACKQYGVSILLSQAVQELMSDVARSKLRHLDTVTVKGSSMKQKIYTYDARHKGVDFFLYSKTDAQADEEANKYYETKIWNMDQDLKAMRQHVTEDFLKEFGSGRKAFLLGDWAVAMKHLERANEIMVETALEEGYLEDEFNAVFQQRAGEDARAAAEELKVKNGDGPSLYLLNFMKSHGGVAPDRWEGWHPLMRK